MEGFASVFYISNKSWLLAFAMTTGGEYRRKKGGESMPCNADLSVVRAGVRHI